MLSSAPFNLLKDPFHGQQNATTRVPRPVTAPLASSPPSSTDAHQIEPMSVQPKRPRVRTLPGSSESQPKRLLHAVHLRPSLPLTILEQLFRTCAVIVVLVLQRGNRSPRVNSNLRGAISQSIEDTPPRARSIRVTFEQSEKVLLEDDLNPGIDIGRPDRKVATFARFLQQLKQPLVAFFASISLLPLSLFADFGLRASG
uniref:(northern house mosquito) hypothetical protein n=2 Tax=Culex pipiens TaxID=7175 RepID=A0A8D8A036_CULPI